MPPKKRERPSARQQRKERKDRKERKGRPQLRRKRLKQQLQHAQERTEQQQQLKEEPREANGFSFGMPELDDVTTRGMWVAEPDAPDVDGMMNDAEEPFWPVKSPQFSEDAVHSSGAPQQQLFLASPDPMHQLHQLHRNLSPGGACSLSESVTDVKQELQEIQRQRQEQRCRQNGQHLQQQHQQSAPLTLPQQAQSQQQTRRIGPVLSPAEQRQLLQMHHQISSHGPSPQKHQLLSPQQQLVAPRPSLPPQASQSTPHNSFSLPQTIAGTSQSKPERASMSKNQFHSRMQTSAPRAFSDESAADPEKYVRQASEAAEKTKVEHRVQLKQQQRVKEKEAIAKGEPLSAKDKERERSRRESAVTRKRAEIYTRELERTARRIPLLEKEIASLQLEVEWLCKELPRGHQQRYAQMPVASSMTGIPCSEGVKSELGLVVSPNLAKPAKALTGFRDLDL